MHRSDIENQLELLYNTYYEELENYTNMKQNLSGSDNRHPHGYYKSQRNNEIPHLEEEEDEDEDDEFEDPSDEDFRSDGGDLRLEEFGTNLIVQGRLFTKSDGKLAITNEYLSGDGHKVLDLMEYLAQKKIKATVEEKEYPLPENDGWDDYDDNTNSSEGENDEDVF